MQASAVVEEDPNPNPNPTLPQELITVEILPLLPVKSLLKFRCVSKTWCSLISDPDFIKSHLKKSTGNKNYANQSLLLMTLGCPVEIYACSLGSILQDKSTGIVNALELPNRRLYLQSSLLGSYNGIVCILEGYRKLVLWNPSLRKSMTLSNSGANHRMYKIFTYGFGYDELNHDYKVVEICCYCRFGINYETIANVYSSESNYWRRIKNYEGGIISSSPGVFTHGIFHWLVFLREGSDNTWGILSLNVENETYGEVKQPNYETGDFNKTLGVLGGCLCVFCNYSDVKMDVWMMKEYGRVESWMKFASIPYTSRPRNRASPFFVSSSGEILMCGGSLLMLYNGREDKISNIEVSMVGNLHIQTAATYIESLVSPHFA